MELEFERNDIVEDLLLCLKPHLPLRPDLWGAPTDPRIEEFFQRADVRAEAWRFICALQRLWGERDLSATADAPGSPAEMNIVGDAEGPEKSGSDPDAAAPIQIGRSRDKPPPSTKIAFTLEKNAKVGEEFCSGIHAAGSADVEIVDIGGLQGIGVVYDAGSRVLCGTPTVAGDYILKIHYRFAPAGPERPLLESECLFTVNPDPRSLWQKRPSDRDAPCWKPDEDKKYMRGAGERRLAAASKRGRSHEHGGGFREDDFFLDVSSGWNVLAVADGAGSAKMSRRASQIAVQKAGEFLKIALDDERGTKLDEAVARSVSRSMFDPVAARKAAYPILGGAVLEAVRAIEEEANTNGIPVKDYSTTLLLSVHKRTFHGHLLASYWVGDGGVAAYRKGLSVEVLGEADSGEFAGQTRFLDRSMVSSYDEILKRIRVTLLDDLTALVLMTDGISDPMFETDRDLADPARWDTFWGEIEPHLTDLAPDVRLLGWLDFWSQGNHDDRTIAVLW